MQENKALITEHQKARLAKDSHVYDHYTKLIDQGAKKTVAIELCMVRYGIYTVSTVYRILKRESKRRTKK